MKHTMSYNIGLSISDSIEIVTELTPTSSMTDAQIPGRASPATERNLSSEEAQPIVDDDSQSKHALFFRWTHC